MTKAQQKKMEQEAKRTFIKKAFGCVLDGVFESSSKNSGSPQIRLIMKNGSRYIRFHRYAQDFNVMIYGSGDVDIEFKEFCHDTVTYRLFAYDGEPDTQESFLEQFRKDICMVITEFVEGADWHIVMDFLPKDDIHHWREAFLDSLEPAKNSNEPLRWEPDWVSKYTDIDE